MTSLRRAFATLTILFALTMPALAGNIHAGVTEPPPPPPTAGSTSSGEPAGQTGDSDSDIASVFTTALSVVQSIFSIF